MIDVRSFTQTHVYSCTVSSYKTSLQVQVTAVQLCTRSRSVVVFLFRVRRFGVAGSNIASY